MLQQSVSDGDSAPNDATMSPGGGGGVAPHCAFPNGPDRFVQI